MKSIRTPARPGGFSLVELIAVTALLSLFGLLLIPAIAATNPAGKSTRCLNNLRQFMAAWNMYAADNGNRVANDYGIAQTEQDIQSGALDNWANNIMTWGATASLDDQSNTNVALVLNGVLGKYLSDPVRVYKCPADTFLSTPQVAAGWPTRLRSISMNSFFGRFSASSDVTAQGLNWFLPQYLQYLKTSSVLKPAKTWVVLDEHPDSVNDGVFINDPGASFWEDIPASYHNGGCGFAFADGHSEIKKWQSRISIPPVRFAYGPTPFDALGRLDFAWYLEHTGHVNASTGLPAFNY